MAVNLLYGEQGLRDEEFWTPLDEPTAIGLEVVNFNPGGIGFEMALLVASDSEDVTVQDDDFGTIDGELQNTTVELDFGIRKTWGAERSGLHPYVGGGLALVTSELEVTASTDEVSASASESDVGIGLYLHAGVLWTIGQYFNLGAEYRILRGTEIEYDSFVPTDVDYDMLALVVGYSF